MNEAERPRISKKMLIGITLYAVIFFATILISNLDAVNKFLAKVLTVLRPVLIGLILAYLGNPFFRFFERKAFFHVRPITLRRWLALLCTYLVLFLIIVGLLLLIIPQLVSSVQTFIQNFDANLDSMLEQVNGLLVDLNQKLPPHEDGSPAIPYLNAAFIREKATMLWGELLKALGENFRPENMGFIKDLFGQASTIVTDSIIGIFISLYLMASKEKRYAQVMKFRRAYFGDALNQRVTYALTVADRSFGGFLRGKLLDSCIVGLLVYTVCVIFNIPYAVLVAVIVGITDIIPVIGPFIGVIPTAIIILLTDPIKVIIFVLAILVIQQIDGNIIAPKILGENTGVSSLCVMIAILVMGDLWGLVGMLVGVPLFATVIEIFKLYLDQRLDQKGLSRDTEMYSDGGYSKEDITPKKKHRKKEKEQPSLGGSGDLSRTEQLRLRIYALARRHRIFTDGTEESLNQFAAEAEALYQKADAETAAEAEKAAADREAQETAADATAEGAEPTAAECPPDDAAAEPTAEQPLDEPTDTKPEQGGAQ